MLHKALEDAVRWGEVSHNVADRAQPPKPGTAEMKVWSTEQIRAFLDFVGDDRLYRAWLLLATTGMRRGEVLGLRWRDVDLAAGRLSVVHTLILAHYQVKVSEPKTGKGRRSVALDPDTVDVLRVHRKLQRDERLAWGPAWQDTGLLHPGGRDPHPPAPLQRLLRTARPSVRTPPHPAPRRPAQLRDRCPGRRHPGQGRERAPGSRKREHPLDTYSHVLPALQEDAANKVAGLILGR
jgi:integrase